VKCKIVSPYALLLCVLVLCLAPSPRCHGGRLPVAASIFPLADMVKQVGKDHVDVIAIIPPGASPHTFSLKPSQVKRIAESRVVFTIGAGLESWTEKLLASDQHLHRKVVLSDDVMLIYGTGEHSREHISGDKTGSANPHIWLDPVIALGMVHRIADALGQADPANREDYLKNGKDYGQDLMDLDHTIKETIAGFRTRKYVSFHSAWVYFARQYALESVGTIEASPGRNPTPKTILKIMDQMKAHQITALFAEPQLNPRIAEVISRQVNARVLLLDPIGGPDLKDRGTYIDLMKHNIGVFQEAMK